ncbi:MAG: GAF domain-containing protein [Lysobacteraceae bacterium]
MSISLSSIREALEGGSPAMIATADLDGVPNLSFLSDVQYVDDRHVALSFQFFNKTRANVLANPFARLMVIHARTAARWRLLVQYQRTETEGPLFERMRARLAGIASEQGMSSVFHLRGSDVYRVLAVEAIACATLPEPPRPSWLAPLRSATARINQSSDIDGLFDELLSSIVREFDIEHALLMSVDPDSGRLFTVASTGYPEVGVGAEVAPGEGVIGAAADVGVPIRINHALADHAYAREVRGQMGDDIEPSPDWRIPLPGLARPGSQLAVPIGDGERTLAVLYVEHPQPGRFSYDLEDALAVLASMAAAALRRFDPWVVSERPVVASTPPSDSKPGDLLRVHREARSGAIFVNDEYVIRGVAGAILWKMLVEHHTRDRREFSNRELRADPALQLPDIADNLSTRLILLQRRLLERPCGVRLQKVGRGRLALEVDRPLQIADTDD